jgi:hypothetical protein
MCIGLNCLETVSNNGPLRTSAVSLWYPQTLLAACLTGQVSATYQQNILHFGSNEQKTVSFLHVRTRVLLIRFEVLTVPCMKVNDSLLGC